MKITEFQKILLLAIVFLCLNYITMMLYQKLSELQIKEGFQDKETENSLAEWTTDPAKIYDAMYAKVYDQLTQGVKRTQGKVDLATSTWISKNYPAKEQTILDAGCGTGITAVALAKQDFGRVIALDQSQPFLDYMKNTVIPQSTLTDEQKQSLVIRKDTLMNPSACNPSEVNHIVCYYFTIYYLEDKETFFRNCYLWTKDGGTLFVEVVNKNKFDPVLESANPLIGFSIQKYFKDRLRTSRVMFNEFEYEAEFKLLDPKAEFFETFRFKTNKVRRQKHILFMDDIKHITQIATTVGWTYTGYQDLTSLGFEYAYVLMFKKA
jgi:SAM-dependent methyltransferase